MPHSLAIDQQNDYYTTDVGSHQVIKWSLSHGYVRSYFFESWRGEYETVWKTSCNFLTIFSESKRQLIK